MRALPLAATLASALLLGAPADPPAASSPVMPNGAPPPLGYVVRNTPYDGRFTFARIRFTPPGGSSGWFEGHPDVKWDHDFPRAETHFMKILQELTTLDPTQGGGNVFGWDEPELTRFPLAYQCEVGFWSPTDAEVAGMRAYVEKGGFVIFDDFFSPWTWDNFTAQLRRVLPDARLVQIDPSHPIFDSFFKVEHPESAAAFGGRRGGPEFWGAFEDNDPSKRLLFVANFNNDIGEGWEWSDTGAFPVDVTSTTYKLGVNYLMYALTH